MQPFKRKIYDRFLEWKRESAGRSALLVEGARRIGKSTIVEEFAKNEYDDYLLLDFGQEDDAVKDNFRNVGNLQEFFRNLFVLKGKELPRRRALIVFDEVQLFPKARQAIKYLVKDGRYDYVETGSLISIRKNAESILVPSEEHRVKMFPMDFEEFLWATGNAVAFDAVRDAFAKRIPLPEAIHLKLMRDFRTYMAVGGMPQAVQAFVDGESYARIDSVKRDILDLYAEDLGKYDADNRDKASVVFRTLPEQLAKRNPVFRFSLVDKNARYRQYVDAVDFIARSMIGNVCLGVDAPEIALELVADRSSFKLYMGDTGLLVTQMAAGSGGKDELYKALVFDKLGANLGMVAENAVAQMLRAAGHGLYFHEFRHRPEWQEQEKRYEIDFLLARRNRICPIEVKSSDYRSHKSIDYLKAKYPQLKLREKFIVYAKNYAERDGYSCLPFYMIPCLGEGNG